jgi:hypothetical protein
MVKKYYFNFSGLSLPNKSFAIDKIKSKIYENLDCKVSYCDGDYDSLLKYPL